MVKYTSNSVFGMTRKCPTLCFARVRMRLECTSYSENINQKDISAKDIFRSGVRVKCHDIVRVRHNKKMETLILP